MTKEDRGWPGHLLGGRVRTSTVALILAFVLVWWLYQEYKPAPPPVQAPATEVVPPGFVPDPSYTWVPRTNVQEPRRTATTTETPTTTGTTSPTESTTPSGTTTSGSPSSTTTSGSPTTSPTTTTASPTATTPPPPGAPPASPSSAVLGPGPSPTPSS